MRELKQEFGRATECPICEHKAKKWVYLLHHLGQVHDKVEKYLPEEAKIPRELQHHNRDKRSSKDGRTMPLLKVEDEVCPTRMFCGQQYDFRCIYCKAGEKYCPSKPKNGNEKRQVSESIFFLPCTNCKICSTYQWSFFQKKNWG